MLHALLFTCVDFGYPRHRSYMLIYTVNTGGLSGLTELPFAKRSFKNKGAHLLWVLVGAEYLTPVSLYGSQPGAYTEM